MTRRQLIKAIGAKRDEGMSDAAIAEELNAAGERTPSQGKEWNQANMSQFMIANGKRKKRARARGTKRKAPHSEVRKVPKSDKRNLVEEIWTSNLSDDSKHTLMEYIYGGSK